MNGQLSEQPLAELIREISSKKLSGRLRLQHQRLVVVVYFDAGNLIYAASNVHALRLREYLIKEHVVSETVLAPFEGRRSDLDLAKALVAEQLLPTTDADRILLRQVQDVLRLGLLWIEGTWEFDHRSHLNEEVSFKIDWQSLLLEAARRMPEKFVATRFRNPAERISPAVSLGETADLLPEEIFLLSRLEKPSSLKDLVALSGLNEPDALRLTYAMALAGLVHREHWKSAFRNETPSTAPPGKKTKPKETKQTPAAEVTQTFVDVSESELSNFLDRVSLAKSHYAVLAVATNASSSEIKTVYYDFARRYHPDRFRKSSDTNLQARIESAFARITQAYDTLRDAGSRAAYDSKLAARARAREVSDTAPRAATSSEAAEPTETANPEDEKLGESQISNKQRAEINFKEGFAANKLGQPNIAVGLFASAARLVPNDARYRAYYGQALAADERTRRLAETELQAALRIEPANADYRIMLAELYRDLGFALRARGEAERALESAPNHQKARELLRNLK